MLLRLDSAASPCQRPAETMAKYVCASHAVATKAGSNIVFVAHNDMQVGHC